MSRSFHVLTPDHRYDDEGDVERSFAGPGFEFTVCRERDHRNLPEEAVRACDALLVWNSMPIVAGLIERLENCRIIARAGVGFDHIDLEAAGRLGIPVCNTPDYGTAEVADHAFALLLALKRSLIPYHKALQDDPVAGFAWARGRNLQRLRGLRLGIIGLGRIGTAVALRAKAFGLEVVAYDPYLPSGQELALNVQRAESLEAMLAGADIVSLHAPLTPETRAMIGAEALATMKPGAMLINTARGALVDLDALHEALRQDRIAAAALDVLPKEPPETEHPLIRAHAGREPWLEGRLIITPHAAWYSPESALDTRRLSVGTLVRYLRDGQLRNCVNLDFMPSGPRPL